MARRILFTFRHSPYGSSLAREGLEALLAAGVYEQEIAALFLNEGVLQLLKDQQPEADKNHGRMLAALPMYGVDRLYADADALKERGMTAHDLLLPVEVLQGDALRALLDSYDQILSF